VDLAAAAQRSEAERGGRMLARAKNNLGPDSSGFVHDSEPLQLAEHPGVPTTRMRWGETLEDSARAILS
jgi:hypothetical protein